MTKNIRDMTPNELVNYADRLKKETEASNRQYKIGQVENCKEFLKKKGLTIQDVYEWSIGRKSTDVKKVLAKIEAEIDAASWNLNGVLKQLGITNPELSRRITMEMAGLKQRISHI